MIVFLPAGETRERSLLSPLPPFNHSRCRFLAGWTFLLFSLSSNVFSRSTRTGQVVSIFQYIEIVGIPLLSGTRHTQINKMSKVLDKEQQQQQNEQNHQTLFKCHTHTHHTCRTRGTNHGLRRQAKQGNNVSSEKERRKRKHHTRGHWVGLLTTAHARSIHTLSLPLHTHTRNKYVGSLGVFLQAHAEGISRSIFSSPALAPSLVEPSSFSIHHMGHTFKYGRMAAVQKCARCPHQTFTHHMCVHRLWSVPT